MSPEHDRSGTDRRTVLKSLAVAGAAGSLASVAPRPAAAQATDLSDWLSNVENADEVVDRTGQSEVTVEVGTQANGGAFGFGPAVVRIDPGTTVVWEWTGEGTPHNVVATDGAFESDMISEASATFEWAAESAGVFQYSCTPHEAMGMKGALVVGDAEVSLGGSGGDATTTPGGNESGGDGGGSGDDGTAASAGEFDYDGWFDGVDNFDGTVDATGQAEVRIEVGTEGNGGSFAFEPAAVQVDPGTTVVWEWTGDGGQHDVVAEDVGIESPSQSESGATYGVELDGSGVVNYVCTPHEGVGMKGAVVVGEPTQSAAIDWLRTGLVVLAGAIVAGPFVASEVAARRRRDDEPPRRPHQPSD